MENSGNIGYSDKMLDKYYQFLDTINKKYEITNDKDSLENKMKNNKTSVTNHKISTKIKNESIKI